MTVVLLCGTWMNNSGTKLTEQCISFDSLLQNISLLMSRQLNAFNVKTLL